MQSSNPVPSQTLQQLVSAISRLKSTQSTSTVVSSASVVTPSAPEGPPQIRPTRISANTKSTKKAPSVPSPMSLIHEIKQNMSRKNEHLKTSTSCTPLQTFSNPSISCTSKVTYRVYVSSSSRSCLVQAQPNQVVASRFSETKCSSAVKASKRCSYPLPSAFKLGQSKANTTAPIQNSVNHDLQIETAVSSKAPILNSIPSTLIDEKSEALQSSQTTVSFGHTTPTVSTYTIKNPGSNPMSSLINFNQPDLIESSQIASSVDHTKTVVSTETDNLCSYPLPSVLKVDPSSVSVNQQSPAVVDDLTQLINQQMEEKEIVKEVSNLNIPVIINRKQEHLEQDHNYLLASQYDPLWDVTMMSQETNNHCNLLEEAGVTELLSGVSDLTTAEDLVDMIENQPIDRNFDKHECTSQVADLVIIFL